MSTATALKKVDTIAIGGFDGMHIGHQHLFNVLGTHGAIVVVETGYANLTPGREREHYSSHPMVYYPLDTIRHLNGKGFLAKLREAFPKLAKIVVGYDFHFGKNRACSHEELKEIFEGEVVVIDEVCVHHDSVHSHKIRAKIKLGHVRDASTFLGHHYTIRGRVVTGQGLGKRELVPTVNAVIEGFLLPKEGVYATLTRIDDEEHFYPSVSFIGHRVTTDGSFAVESHILDVDIACHDRVSISFIGFIRENQRFETLDALKAMIELDIKRAKMMLGHLSL